MCKRLERFESFREHPWLKKAFKKLSAKEVQIARDFIHANSKLDRNAFEMAVNRMFMDHPCKPKSWTVIVELLANSNSATSTSPQA